MDSKTTIRFEIKDKYLLDRLEELKESLQIKTNAGVIRRLIKHGKL